MCDSAIDHWLDASTPPRILLVRHARRNSLREASIAAAFEEPLNQAGRDHARAFGARTRGQGRVRLRHSPVPRCEETASLIDQQLRRAGEDVATLGPWDQLGAPFLLDPERAVELFARLTMEGFVQSWLTGELDPDIVQPHRQAAMTLLAALLDQRRADPGAALWIDVGHDLTLVTLLGLCFPVVRHDFPWPGFLDGCVLWGSDPVLCQYHGETRPMPSLDNHNPSTPGVEAC